MKNYFILVAFILFMPFSLSSRSCHEDDEDIPILLNKSDKEDTTIHRTTEIIPIDCFYCGNINAIVVNARTEINKIEVVVSNIITGEVIQEKLYYISGIVQICEINTSGVYIVEFIINDNKTYSGVLCL